MNFMSAKEKNMKRLLSTKSSSTTYVQVRPFHGHLHEESIHIPQFESMLPDGNHFSSEEGAHFNVARSIFFSFHLTEFLSW